MNKLKLSLISGYLLAVILLGCSWNEQSNPVKPKLKVSENNRYLAFENGEPFFWLGGTTWGMSEWLTREGVDYYLDNRKEKGFNLVQICLFWGKRVDDPVNFSVNPPNAYGFQAFVEVEGEPDPAQPRVIEKEEHLNLQMTIGIMWNTLFRLLKKEIWLWQSYPFGADGM